MHIAHAQYKLILKVHQTIGDAMQFSIIINFKDKFMLVILNIVDKRQRQGEIVRESKRIEWNN